MWGGGQFRVSNSDKRSLSSDRHILLYTGHTHTYVEQSRGLLCQNYSTQQKSGTKDRWCASVVMQSQLLQAHSIHKSKVVTSSLLQRPSVTFTFISLKQAMSLLDSAVVFLFLLARFLSLAFQGGSLYLFLSPCVLNNCSSKKFSNSFRSRMKVWVTYTNS